MKKYYILACFLIPNSMSGMEQSSSYLSLVERTKKQHLIPNAFYPFGGYLEKGKLKKAAFRQLLSEIDINYRYPAFGNATVLIQAIFSRNLVILKEVLATPGLDASITTSNDKAALHLAVGYPSALRVLITSKISLTPLLDLNQQGLGGATPLYDACQCGNVESVRLLCAEPEVNPNIPAQEYCDGNYPLHMAVTGRLPEKLLIIRALADKGAFMECENNNKETPFLLAFKSIKEGGAIAYDRIIALLALGAQKKQLITHRDNASIIQQADITTNIENQIQWFSIATKGGQTDLLEESGDRSFLDACFRTAVKGINPGDIEALLPHIGEKGINRQDAIYGMTALMWAAALGHLELARLLLTHPEIDVAARDSFGDTALHYAARNGHANVAQLLLERPEALAMLQNTSSATPYDLAKMRDHKAVGRLLGHERIIQTRIMRYFTTRAKNNADAPTGWRFLPDEIALRILAYRAWLIDPEDHRIHKIIELCTKENS